MELAKAYVQIVPSADGIKGKLTSALGGEASEAGNSAGSIAGGSMASMITKVVAAAGIGKAISGALNEGAALQQSLGGIETLFKDSSDKVIENAKNAYKTAGMSANEYMESVTSFSASLLQGLGGNTDAAADVADMALTDMSDNANKMGTDMELIQNAYQGFAKQNYTMLDNLKLGYGGTKTEMQRLLADAEAFSGVKYDINNLSDVYSAIHVVQGEMEISGRTADEVAEIAKNTGRTVKEQLGTTAKEGATTFSGSMASMKSAFSNVLGNLTLGEDIGPSLGALMDTVFTFVTGNLLPMVGNVLSGLPELLSGVLTMAVRGLNIVADNADSIVQNGIDFIGQLVIGIVSALPYLAEAAIGVATSLGSALVNTDWMSVATDLMSGLKENLDIASGEILGTDGNMLGSVSDMITNNLPGFLEKGKEIITNITNGILENVPGLITSAGTIVTNIVNFIGQNLPTLLKSGADILGNILDGIVNNLPGIATSITKVFENIITAIANHLPNILSAGGDILLNLIDGIVKNFPKIITTMGTMIIDMVAAIGKNLPKILKSGVELIGKLLAGIIKAVPKLIAAIPEILKNLADAFMKKDWGKIGLDIIKGVAEGLKNAASMVWDAIKEVAGSAFDAAKKAILGDSSKDSTNSSSASKGVLNVPKGTYGDNSNFALRKAVQTNAYVLQTAVAGTYETKANKPLLDADYYKMGYGFAKALGEFGLEVVLNDRVVGRMMRKAVT